MEALKGLMSVRIAMVFPGQGTQASGMGRAWKGDSAWRIVDQLETETGINLCPLILDATDEQLSRTADAQLAVLTTSLLAYTSLREILPDDIEIVGYAGHSLGQLSALIAAGVLAPGEGTQFAVRRAEATQAAADANPGKMVALLGAEHGVATEACAQATDGAWQDSSELDRLERFKTKE